MGNPTSRQLQTLQPLSTFEFCPSGTDHDESVNDHALLTPLTLQIIMAIMVTFCALYLDCTSVQTLNDRKDKECLEKMRQYWDSNWTVLGLYLSTDSE